MDAPPPPPPAAPPVHDPAAVAATLVDGLPGAIDAVAARAAGTHGFLRRGWYAAALAAYGGRARTLIVRDGTVPAIALPFADVGPRALGLGSVPGCYWPFRGFPAAADAPAQAWDALVRALGTAVRVLRVGPVPDDDASMAALVVAARAAGWVAVDRPVARGWLLDIAARDWPRGSTLRKNRFHEKHLAAHGAVEWRMASGADWPATFALMAEVERRSWVGTRTDGRDAKFAGSRHAAFWRAAAADPVLADAMSAALLLVDGRPAAFSFDVDAGATRHAIANSYDPAFARHSPGRLVQYRNLAAARSKGIVRVDWGAGDPGYKAAMGAVAGPVHRDWLLLRPGVAAAAGSPIARLWRARVA